MASGPSPELNDTGRAAFAHRCPEADTNLAGTLGIKDFVAMGAQVPRLPLEAAKPRPGEPASAPATNATQAFGGTISFVVTKGVSGVGPTWTTTRFNGPGGLLGLSRVNTDKITVAFAQGPNVGTSLAVFSEVPPRAVKANGPNVGAYNLVQQQITQSIGSQLQSLMNQLH